jgi:hypothetical protein
MRNYPRSVKTNKAFLKLIDVINTLKVSPFKKYKNSRISEIIKILDTVIEAADNEEFHIQLMNNEISAQTYIKFNYVGSLYRKIDVLEKSINDFIKMATL